MPKKFEEEIEEILRKTGDLRPRTSMSQLFKEAQQRFRRQFGFEFGKTLRWLTPTRVGGTGAVLLVVGLVMRSAPIAILALGILLGAYFLAVIRGSRTFQETTGYDKSWRGRPIDTPPAQPNWRKRFRRWFSKKG
ncbi:MAG: hypothetical protein V3V35_06835 [Dehalococcoidia bacterium]